MKLSIRKLTSLVAISAALCATCGARADADYDACTLYTKMKVSCGEATSQGQYVQTDFTPTSSTIVRGKYKLNAFADTQALFSARNATTQPGLAYYCKVKGNSTVQICYNQTYVSSAVTVAKDVVYTFEAKDGKFQLCHADGTPRGAAFGTTKADFTPVRPLTLFNVFSNGAVGTSGANVDFYYLQFFDVEDGEEVLIHEYRPAVDAQGVVCVADTVEEKLFYNGTGRTDQLEVDPLDRLGDVSVESFAVATTYPSEENDLVGQVRVNRGPVALSDLTLTLYCGDSDDVAEMTAVDSCQPAADGSFACRVTGLDPTVPKKLRLLVTGGGVRELGPVILSKAVTPEYAMAMRYQKIHVGGGFSGGQRVNTGYYPRGNTVVRAKYAVEQRGQNQVLCMARVTSAIGPFYCGWLSEANRFRCDYSSNNTVNNRYTTKDPTALDHVYEIEMKDGGVTILRDGQPFDSIAALEPKRFLCDTPMFLFTLYTATGDTYGSFGNNANIAFYGLSVFEYDDAGAERLVHEYVPAVDEWGTACLADRVEGRLLYNESGVDGQFTSEAEDAVEPLIETTSFILSRTEPFRVVSKNAEQVTCAGRLSSLGKLPADQVTVTPCFGKGTDVSKFDTGTPVHPDADGRFAVILEGLDYTDADLGVAAVVTGPERTSVTTAILTPFVTKSEAQIASFGTETKGNMEVRANLTGHFPGTKVFARYGEQATSESSAVTEELAVDDDVDAVRIYFPTATGKTYHFAVVTVVTVDGVTYTNVTEDAVFTRAAAGTRKYTGLGADAGDLNDPMNWSPNQVPTSSDTVSISTTEGGALDVKLTTNLYFSTFKIENTSGERFQFALDMNGYTFNNLTNRANNTLAATEATFRNGLVTLGESTTLSPGAEGGPKPRLILDNARGRVAGGNATVSYITMNASYSPIGDIEVLNGGFLEAGALSGKAGVEVKLDAGRYTVKGDDKLKSIDGVNGSYVSLGSMRYPGFRMNLADSSFEASALMTVATNVTVAITNGAFVATGQNAGITGLNAATDDRFLFHNVAATNGFIVGVEDANVEYRLTGEKSTLQISADMTLRGTNNVISIDGARLGCGTYAGLYFGAGVSNRLEILSCQPGSSVRLYMMTSATVPEDSSLYLGGGSLLTNTYNGGTALLPLVGGHRTKLVIDDSALVNSAPRYQVCVFGTNTVESVLEFRGDRPSLRGANTAIALGVNVTNPGYVCRDNRVRFVLPATPYEEAPIQVDYSGNINNGRLAIATNTVIEVEPKLLHRNWPQEQKRLEIPLLCSKGYIYLANKSSWGDTSGIAEQLTANARAAGTIPETDYFVFRSETRTLYLSARRPSKGLAIIVR